MADAKRQRRERGPDTSPPLSNPSMSKALFGKYVLITGGTSGLGAEIARCAVNAAAAGVVITGREAERGAAVVAALTPISARQQILAFKQADLANPEDCAAVFEFAKSKMGYVDCLVNCAAICFPRGSLTGVGAAPTSVELWDQMQHVNLRAPFLLSQAFATALKAEGKRGSIVNIASCCATGGAPFVLAYSCSKAGLLVLTKNNAQELRSSGIRVNAINVGWMLTDAEDTGQTAEKGEGWLEEADAGSPTGRILRPVDIAATVLHLLSDASTMTTGAVIDIAPDVIPGMMPGGVG